MKKTNWKKFCYSWSSVAVVVGGIACSAQAQDVQAKKTNIQAKKDETYGDWTVKCIVHEGTPPCRMLQVVTNSKSKQPVMVFAIVYAGREESYGFQISVPLGVLVSGGALIRIDEREQIQDLKFTRCLTTGCQIEGQIDAEKIQPLRQGTRGILAILDSQGKPVIFPVSLKGFGAAMDAMAVKNRAWAKS